MDLDINGMVHQDNLFQTKMGTNHFKVTHWSHSIITTKYIKIIYSFSSTPSTHQKIAHHKSDDTSSTPSYDQCYPHRSSTPSLSHPTNPRKATLKCNGEENTYVIIHWIYCVWTRPGLIHLERTSACSDHQLRSFAGCWPSLLPAVF